ncbi:DUF2306 domain-containing protein [Rhizobium sp. AG855]|uniref:DUF2306 domain-containing protein n=1 Tax=Rhizobium sp. AG855 TaxID=2183898 RepID=UPI000E74674B|nr:DUF2306 domain-containing protein [Rhizobium sp. AG855]RKE84233.1 putative membrane protein [Rhizobium sp. AG855]
MSLSLLLQASPAIQIHVAAAVSALLLGTYLLVATKGTTTHKSLGRIWIGIMVVTSFSSFFIHSLRLVYGFSPIHLLSVLTLVGSWQAVAAARAGRIAEHRRHVGNLYSLALLTAGAFTLLPGRLMHKLLFGEGQGQVHLLVIGMVLVLVVFFQWWLRRDSRRRSG